MNDEEKEKRTLARAHRAAAARDCAMARSRVFAARVALTRARVAMDKAKSARDRTTPRSKARRSSTALLSVAQQEWHTAVARLAGARLALKDALAAARRARGEYPGRVELDPITGEPVEPTDRRTVNP